MRERLAGILPLAIAVVLPLAGLVMAVNYAAQGDREMGLRMGLATAAGVFLYAALLL